MTTQNLECFNCPLRPLDGSVCEQREDCLPEGALRAVCALIGIRGGDIKERGPTLCQQIVDSYYPNNTGSHKMTALAMIALGEDDKPQCLTGLKERLKPNERRINARWGL